MLGLRSRVRVKVNGEGEGTREDKTIEDKQEKRRQDKGFKNGEGFAIFLL